MNGTGHDDDGYAGPATLEVGPGEFEVRVLLRGVFQPIDGRYHWYGRIERHEALTAALGASRAAGRLITPEGSAPCELSDPDPWQRYRVTGASTPPFAAGPFRTGPLATGPLTS
jgi:Domain of unknown function (DUF4873)